MEPRGKGIIRRELPRLARECAEDVLGNFLGAACGADLVQRGGKDEVNMPPDDFADAVLVSCPGELLQPLEIRLPLIHVHP
jgi:hypothetical protein